jgi:SAM-dependent methyltransferase
MSDAVPQALTRALWRIYRRPARPLPWVGGGNLPWDDAAFSARMLREHLDDSHGAASRQAAERDLQLAWLWDRLALRPGARVLDATCGPGLYAVPLAQRGCEVTGIDFSPAAIAYARDYAGREGVADHCVFLEQDVRQSDLPPAAFDAALFLYGQLAVFPHEEARALLERLVRTLRPGGALAVELLDQERVDKQDSTWWYTDDAGLWGDAPYLHLGERFWMTAEEMSAERYLILHLDSGKMDEILLCDQTYSAAAAGEMMSAAGFSGVTAYPGWDGLPLYDAGEWIAYIGIR